MKNYYLLAALAITILMASCGSNNTKIDSKVITKLFNEKTAEMCMDKLYTTIDTGYYELNDLEDRMVLQKLAKAGVIEYNVERFAWYNKCTNIENTTIKIVDYYCEGTDKVSHSNKVYGRDTVVSYNYEEHFMVSVRISSKYKSMLVDSIPVPDIEDKDMVFPKYKEWPEDNLENNESWPKLEEPKTPEPPHERKTIKCHEPREYNQQVSTKHSNLKNEEKVTYPICVPMDKAMAQKYAQAHERERVGKAYILGYEVKAVKARNIQTFTKKDGTEGARCEVIIKSDNVTPQGHILMDNIIDDIPAKVDITLTYFVDKGWVIDEVDEEKEEDEKTMFSLPKIDPKNVISDIIDTIEETLDKVEEEPEDEEA